MPHWLSRKPCRPSAVPPPARRPVPGAGSAPEPPDERVLGCGWFDSSHELQRGLQVKDADAETLSKLPLGDWLDLHLQLQLQLSAPAQSAA